MSRVYVQKVQAPKKEKQSIVFAVISVGPAYCSIQFRWSDRRDNLDLYDPDLMLTILCSKYYSVYSFNKLLLNSD